MAGKGDEAMRMWNWNRLILEHIISWFGTLFTAIADEAILNVFQFEDRLRKHILKHSAVCFAVVGILMMVSNVFHPVVSHADAIAPLTLVEIVVTGDAITEPMATQVGVKQIEKGKNIDIPDVLGG
jgi:hypothetical protein